MRKGSWLILVVAALLLGIGTVGCGEKQKDDAEQSETRAKKKKGDAKKDKGEGLKEKLFRQIWDNEHKFFASQMYVMAKFAQEKFGAKSALIIMDEGFKGDPRTPLVVAQGKKFIPNVQYGTLDVPPAMVSLNERMRASHFNAFTDQYKDVDVIITMVGIPVDCKNCNVIKARMGNKEARPVVLMIGYPEMPRDLKKLVNDETIPALITVRKGAQYNDDPPPTSMEDTFKVRYEMVTKDNLQDYANVIGAGW